MAYQNNNYQKENQQNNQQNNHITVSHVMTWQDGSVTFTLTIHGVTIYGMRVIGFTDKRSGQHKRFVAFPKRRGSDGKYYHIAYYKLSEIEEDKILRIVDNSQ